jgi:hypothetical protein
MKRWIIGLLVLSLATFLGAQSPQSRLSWEDKSGTTGHTLVVGGKSYGPYKDIESIYYSNDAKSVGFTVSKRDRSWVVAGGTEFGPLPAGFEAGSISVADDGKLWSLSATKYSEDEDTPSVSQLFVNGKSYGPYQDVVSFDYAEQGGMWLASVQTGEDQQKVLVEGKESPAYATIEHLWVTVDGTGYGYLATDADGNQHLVTQDVTLDNVQDTNFDMMYPREPHWAYAYRNADNSLVVVVDGVAYQNFLHFGGLVVPPSGNGWGFEGERMTDAGDYSVVMINGQEYVGEGLYQVRVGAKETFFWTVRDGSKSTVQALPVGP